MTSKAKPLRARIGDVFVAPVSPDQRIYGQVVDKVGPQHLGVLFRSSTGPIEEILTSGIELAGILFDAKWRNGDWPIVANLPPVNVKSPWFVLGHDGLGNLRLETFDGSKTRLTSATEAAEHGHRNLSYPMVLQSAAAALQGDGEWKQDFDHFRRLAREM